MWASPVQWAGPTDDRDTLPFSTDKITDPSLYIKKQVLKCVLNEWEQKLKNGIFNVK